MVVLVLPLTSLGLGLLPTPKTPIASLPPVVKKIVQGVVHTTNQASQAVAGHSGQTGATYGPAGSTNYTQPAMYGTNPHGQGTVLSVQTPPSTSVPYPYNPAGSGGETAVAGRGRSEQGSGGKYHAHTTILALLGTEILGVDASQGQSKTGPLSPIQQNVLDKVCSGSGNMICLAVLTADTVASAGGAHTNFSVLNADVGGSKGVKAGVATSKSSIKNYNDGSRNCQTSSGSSNVANANVGGKTVADVARSSSTSTACSDGYKSNKQSSQVINLLGTGVPLPASGCANGTPNTTFSIPGVITTVCNAEDKSQAAAPAGVRQALAVVVLPIAVTLPLATSQGPIGLPVKTVLAASESHAVAPAGPKSNCTDSDKDCGSGPPITTSCPGYPIDNVDNDGDCDHAQGGNNGGGNNGGGNQGGPGACPDADADCGRGPAGTGACANDISDHDGDCVSPTGASETGASHARFADLTTTTAAAKTLPFTGEDLLKLVLVGLMIAAGGLAVRLRLNRTNS